VYCCSTQRLAFVGRKVHRVDAYSPCRDIAQIILSGIHIHDGFAIDMADVRGAQAQGWCVA